MKILGIETSCDETAAAVVEDGTKILSNVVATSAEMHAKTGGIIPEQAARQQVRSIVPVVDAAMTNAKCQMTNIDSIAVTVGPGLIGSLLVGVETAKTIAYLWKKPVVPVNHLAAHIYANWLEDSEHQTPQFPALALVVSGGHTDLVLMKGHPSASPSATSSRPSGSGQANIKWIGGTRDDAAGEAFDKTARLLGLPYPGGPAISAEAEKFFNSSQFTDHRSLTMFPRPMIDEDNFDWSFSGLKTAVFRELTNQQINKSLIPRLAAEIQEAIVDVLVEKTLKAVKKFRPASLLLAGGVTANKRLREKLKLEIGNKRSLALRAWKLPTKGGSASGGEIDFHVPPSNLCTDNATYIATFAYFNHSPAPWNKIAAKPELTIVGEA